MSTTSVLSPRPEQKPISKVALWLHKVSHWEFWPFGLLYSPIYFYWAWLTLRLRSFFFFTASNPGIEFGGMLGESKTKILKALPARWLPRYFKVEAHANTRLILDQMHSAGMSFPIIVKPDIGERGWLVSKIEDENALMKYLDQGDLPPLLIQEFIAGPIELGVFYCRKPDSENGVITGITGKNMLTVVGDGYSTLKALIRADFRASMHWDKLKIKWKNQLDAVPKPGEAIELVGIGNHAKGTTFLNYDHLITEQLAGLFDHISRQVDGFYFGRFDIRCSSVQDLYDGNFYILELNGAGAEPSHIYQPGTPLREAYGEIIRHLNLLAEISRLNIQKGVKPYSITKGLKAMLEIRKFNRRFKK